MPLTEDPGSPSTGTYPMMAVSRRKVAVCGSGLGRYIAESIITRCAGRWDLVFISRHVSVTLSISFLLLTHLEERHVEF